MDTVSQLLEALTIVLRHMVDEPERLHLFPEAYGEGFKIRIEAAEKDLGKIIGRDGRTARALRTVVSAISLTQKIPIVVTIRNRADSQE